MVHDCRLRPERLSAAETSHSEASKQQSWSAISHPYLPRPLFLNRLAMWNTLIDGGGENPFRLHSLVAQRSLTLMGLSGQHYCSGEERNARLRPAVSTNEVLGERNRENALGPTNQLRLLDVSGCLHRRATLLAHRGCPKPSEVGIPNCRLRPGLLRPSRPDQQARRRRLGGSDVERQQSNSSKTAQVGIRGLR